MTDEDVASLPDQVRMGCAWVAEHARAVMIDEDAIAPYAESLGSGTNGNGSGTAGSLDVGPAPGVVDGDREARAAFVICLDAINFGSGWWPTIRKRPGHSGYFTIAAALADRFRESGAWPAEELAELSATDVARVMGQDPDHPLMDQFAQSLRDVGAHVMADQGGRFLGVAESGGGSAVAVAETLSRWTAFADVSTYDGRPVPFFKRAQIAASDLKRAGVVDLQDEDRLTAFADNLVPHVLRVDGVLRLDPDLEHRIDAGELLIHDSPEEVELRACGIHTVELLSTAIDRRLPPAAIDHVLWNRGGQPRYKAIPRPRSRNTAY